MRVNGLLIRWSGGYSAEFDAQSEGDEGRVIWRLLDLPHVREYEEVERIALAEFDKFAQEQLAFTMTVDTRNGPVPFDDYDIGDTVLVPNIQAGTTTVRVTGMMVTEDEDGGVYYAPEVGEQFEDDITRLKRITSRTLPGSLDGRSELVAPVPGGRRDVGTQSRVRDRTIATYSHSGALTEDESGDFEWHRHEVITEVVGNAKVAGGSNSVFDLLHDGVSFGTLTIAANQTRGTVEIDCEEVDNLDKGSVDVTTDGGHEDVTIQFLRSP